MKVSITAGLSTINNIFPVILDFSSHVGKIQVQVKYRHSVL